MAMFMKTLYTPGVAHLSYIFGDGGQAAAIDPRRDVNEYLEIAHRRGAKISLLVRMGFKDVRNVPGSWKAWKAAGYAVQKPKERKKGTDTNLS